MICIILSMHMRCLSFQEEDGQKNELKSPTLNPLRLCCWRGAPLITANRLSRLSLRQQKILLKVQITCLTMKCLVYSSFVFTIWISPPLFLELVLYSAKSVIWCDFIWVVQYNSATSILHNFENRSAACFENNISKLNQIVPGAELQNVTDMADISV